MDISKSVLICLVSRQAMANVIPAVMYKPAKVLLLSTDMEKSTAANICSMLNSKSIKCEIFPDILQPYDVTGTEAIISRIIANNQINPGPVLNATGGTKLMAFAAYNAFRRKKCNIIYCNSEGNNIIQLYPDILHETIEVKISVEEYLNAYGYPTKKESDNSSEFIRYVDGNGLLNSFVKNVNDVRKNNAFKLLSYSHPLQLGKFLITRKDDPFISISHNNNTFTGIHKKFINGFWLEDYFFYKLKLMNPDDIKSGVHISAVRKNNLTELQNENIPYNEIDIVAVKNGRLNLFSCKSGAKSKEDLFELEGLRTLAGGTFSKAHTVITKSTQFYTNRAKDMKINVIDVQNTWSFKL